MKSLRLTVCGAGHIGETIARMLVEAGATVTLADRDPARLAAVAKASSIRGVEADLSNPAALADLLAGQRIVVSASPYFLNLGIARAAAAAGVHYFDLTEDVRTTQGIRTLSRGADTVFVPQCGLAPGFVGIVGNDLGRSFERLKTLHMRVGALPRFPTNALKYNLTWSTDGLINEYCNECEVILDGRVQNVLALEGLEAFSLDGEDYEAFNTSGGLGTLCESWEGRVESMSYKTIRYPGHRDLVKVLLQDLALREDRETLKRILERSIPETSQDVVILFVSATGIKDGRLVQDTFLAKVFGRPHESAIQATTAGGLMAMVELFLAGLLPQKGFVRQEDAALEAALATRGGRVYREGLSDPARHAAGIGAATRRAAANVWPRAIRKPSLKKRRR
jgi:saccharopine dehydrogenase-like NADP-dependent oxidoreductase